MKKFIRMAAMLAVAGAALLTSCTKDYSADIEKLQNDVASLQKTVEAIQGQIANGVVLKSVNKTANGVQIILNDGTSYEVTNGTNGENGKPGTPGTVVTINDEGYWCIDGVPTEYKAATDPAPVAKEGITAIVEEGKLTLKGVEGGEGEEKIVVISLNGEIAYISVLPGDTAKSETDNGYKDGYANIGILNVIEKDNEFGPSEDDVITFVKGDNHSYGTSIILRVSPNNAVLEPEKIHLINSLGEELDELVVDEIKPYDNVLLAKSANSGLYKVKFNLKENADVKAFEKKLEKNVSLNPAAKDMKPIVFAVAYDLNAGQAISGYDITVKKEAYTPANVLKFVVDNTPVNSINNRYKGKTGKSILETSVQITYQELAWAASTQKNPTPATAANKDNVTSDTNDDRSDKDLYQAIQGVPFTVKLGEIVNNRFIAANNIRGMYVVLDKQNAVESSSSELSAWKYYDYEGLNKVVDSTSVQITVDCKDAINDIIGFRVYAVNMDGTLVDPDGRAFYVQIGKGANEWNGVATVVVPEHEVIATTKSEIVEVATSATPTAAKATWTTDKINNTQPVFDVYFVDKDGDEIEGINTTDPDALYAFFQSADNAKKVAGIYTVKKSDIAWNKYVDDHAYAGKLAILDATGRELAVMNVSFTKQLPTDAPKGYSRKTYQVVDDVYNCYLIPNTWTAGNATSGKMTMVEAFNFPEKYQYNYYMAFAESQEITDNGELIDWWTYVYHGYANYAGYEEYGNLEVAKKYIDNETPHATYVIYNYGAISSEKDEDDEYVEVEFVVDYFETVYSCIYNNTYSWKWAENDDVIVRTALNEVAPDANYLKKNNNDTYAEKLPTFTEVVYGETIEILGGDLALYVNGISSRDSRYSKHLNTPYENSLKIVEATLTSNANDVEEYMKPIVADGKITGFEVVSQSTNPVGDVASTLTITVVDMYGHEIPIKLAMTVKSRNN